MAIIQQINTDPNVELITLETPGESFTENQIIGEPGIDIIRSISQGRDLFPADDVFLLEDGILPTFGDILPGSQFSSITLPATIILDFNVNDGDGFQYNPDFYLLFNEGILQASFEDLPSLPLDLFYNLFESEDISQEEAILGVEEEFGISREDIDPNNDGILEGSLMTALDGVTPLAYILNISKSESEAYWFRRVSVDAPNLDITEGETGQFEFTIPPQNNDIVVNYSLGGTAENGVDYNIPLSVTIPAQTDSATVDITALADAIPESQETIEITILPSENDIYGINGLTNTATININDGEEIPAVPEVTIDAGNPDIIEGTAGQFIFNINSPQDNDILVNYAIDGSATNGEDYETIPLSVTIPAQSTSVVVDIAAIADENSDSGETIEITLQPSENSSYTVGGVNPATITINDATTEEEPNVGVLPEVTVDAPIFNTREAGLPGQFVVSIDSPQSEGIAINYNLGGTAINGQDYQPITGPFIFIPPGETSVLLEISAIPDIVSDSGEIVELTIEPSGDNSYTIAGDNPATVNIFERSVPSNIDIFLLLDDTGGLENTIPSIANELVTTIEELQSELPDVSFGFGVGRFEDFNSNPFILNQPIITTNTPGFNNAIQTAFNQSSPGGTGSQSSIEGLFQVATGQGFDSDGNGAIDSGDVPPFSSFTPNPANNVLQPSGNLGGVGFRPGALPVVLVATDSGFTYQDDGSRTIVGAGAITVDVSAFEDNNIPVTPNNNGATIQETISALNSIGAFVVGLGTGTDSSSAPREGLEALATLTGGVNRSPVAIESSGTGEPINQGEPLYFLIDANSGASVTQGISDALREITGAILEPVELTVNTSTPNITEGGEPGQFILSIDSPQNNDIVVDYVLQGTSTNSLDYEAIEPLSVTIPAGSTSAVIDINTIDDRITEPVETVDLILQQSDRYSLGAINSASISINDNLPEITVNSLNSNITEGGEPGQFVFNINIPQNNDIIVDYVLEGTSTNSIDYATIPLSVTIPAGSSNAVVNINAIDDRITEPVETVNLTLQNSDRYNLGGINTASVSINDPRELNFDNVQDLEEYNTDPLTGVTFANAVGIISFEQEGSGNFIDSLVNSSQGRAITYSEGDSIIMNVPGGFSEQLSFRYASPFVNHRVVIYDGLNGSGNILGDVVLARTPESSENFGAYILTGEEEQINFNGQAQSVSFGSAPDKLILDDIRLFG